MIDSYSILLHNGRLESEHQPAQLLPEGVIAGSLTNKQHADDFNIIIPANTHLAKPIQIINRLDDDRTPPVHYQIVLEAGSSAQLMISDHSISSEPSACNYTMDVTLGAAAHLELVRLQKINEDASLNTVTTVEQSVASRMKTHYVTLGGGAIQNCLKVTLSGKNAEHIAAGLSLTQHKEHVDSQIKIIHASPDCQSSQLFKNILSDTSTGAFTGHIIVNKDAQKTAAFQRNKNILMHPKAKMDIRPHLEIYADDVKCSHGATVGQLDAEALFYLCSRGIGEEEAKKMLLRAFTLEVLDGISCEAFREIVLQHAKMQE